MAYERTVRGEKCLTQTDGAKVLVSEVYEGIRRKNPRLGSAVQILMDLGLLKESEVGLVEINAEGLRLLEEELGEDAVR